jgi:copper chaperone CopZ
MTQTFQAHAPDISCEGCARSIKRSLGALPGVQTVEVDIPCKNVTVEYDGTQLKDTEILARLEKAGFPVRA